MEEGLKFDYYYGVQSEQFSFYRIPRLLIKDQHLKACPVMQSFCMDLC